MPADEPGTAKGSTVSERAWFTVQTSFGSIKVFYDGGRRIDDIRDEPNELIPEAYDKLNAFYTENEKRINKRGEALAYVLSTGDIRVNNYAALEEFLRRLAPVGWCLRKVARVHPFVKVAVDAFEVAISSLNFAGADKMVLAAFQIEDMMCALFELRHVHDSEEKGPDGIVLKDRMSGLIESITADIEQCGDKWTNKGLMSKMLRSKAYYEEQFAGYVEKFRNYKEEIGRALAVHTTYSASQALIDNIEMPSEQIPKADDAHEELNEFYRNHKKTLKHGGDVFVSVFKTGDFGADRETATNEFFDRYSVLHGGLTRLAQAHPFVGVVVYAFRMAIVSLDAFMILSVASSINNKLNDAAKQMELVAFQMADMMSALFQLRHVRDSEEKGPDGITLKNRMSGLMRLIVNDIRECKDKWKNKGFASQMLRSKAYFERRFAGYVEKFRDYKNNIRQVLAGHLALKKVQRLNDDPDDLTVSDNNETELVALIDNHLSSDPGLMFDADVASEPVKKIETKANSSLDPHIATGSNRVGDVQSTDLRLPQVIAEVSSILQNPVTYKRLLACRGSDAQSVLNLLQSLLDMDSTLPMRPLLFKALIRLSRASGLHPECLPLGIIPRLGQLVAGGGFGDIYKGVISEQVVAIKIIKVYDYSDKQAVLKAFGREALIWRQLSHPNLLPFLGIYHVEGRPCLVSPWMENGNVMQFLKIYRNFSEQQRLSFILDVALGLKYLHQNNVVHGDLKGVNILVTPSARACIADFGLSSIAHATSQKFTHTTTDATQGGTARYLPPELISGDRKRHFVSDIYSFACVGYEILTGNVPFHQIREDVTVALKVLDGERPLRPALPSSTFPLDELWALFEGCWKDDPEIRPTAVEIVEQLVSRTRAAALTSTADWDVNYASAFRRSVQVPLPLVPLSHMTAG